MKMKSKIVMHRIALMVWGAAAGVVVVIATIQDSSPSAVTYMAKVKQMQAHQVAAAK